MSESQIYQKKTEKERILLRPDSYVGSIKEVERDEWCLSNKTTDIPARDHDSF